MTPPKLADGDQNSPRFDEWLLALGRATYEAGHLSLMAFDLLRVHFDADEDDMYDDALGRLVSKLRGSAKSRPDWPELASWIDTLDAAREQRNDLTHALPVRDGLHRRKGSDPYFVRDFFTVESLEEIAAAFDAVSREGNTLLYRDGGSHVRAWMLSGTTM